MKRAVRRTGDSVKGTLRLYAKRDGAWAKFEWKDGHKVAGWPEPQLDAVLSHLNTHAPHVAIVTDGQTCWWRWGADEAWQHKPLVNVSNIANGARLVSEIWPSLEEIYNDPFHNGVQPTTQRDPLQPNGVILETVSKAHWQGTPEDEWRVARKRKVSFLENLGPLPLKNTYEEYDAEGELWSRTQTDYSLGDLKMYRPPVRVPLYWRSTRESPRSQTLPESYHLFPLPGVRLDAEWFSNPVERWPRATAGELP